MQFDELKNYLKEKRTFIKNACRKIKKCLAFKISYIIVLGWKLSDLGSTIEKNLLCVYLIYN